MRGKAVILTPVLEGVQGRNELSAGGVELVFAAAVSAADAGALAIEGEPVADDGVLGAVAAAIVAAVPEVDATAGVAADPASDVGGNDTGAGGPIWLDRAYAA